MNQTRFISKIEIKPRQGKSGIEKRSSNDSGNFDNSSRKTSNSYISVGQYSARRKSILSIKCNNNDHQAWTDQVKICMNSVQNRFNGPDGKLMDKPRATSAKQLAEFVEKTMLSDEGLLNNGYITLRMADNEGGWLSIRMLSTTKHVKNEMKALNMRDWRFLAVALCIYLDESKYTVTDCGNFLRKNNGIPADIVAKHRALKECSNKVILIGVPYDICRNMTALTKLTTCDDEGVTASKMQLIEAGGRLDKELSKYQEAIPDLGTKDCLVVSYPDENKAIKAVKHVNGRYFGIRAGVLRKNVGEILYQKKLIENDVKNSLIKKLPCCN